jgi:peptidoglycan/xylan/chitin deacetylase (PgdA/CDA1 family)
MRLVVDDRPAGWRGAGTVPLLDPAETAAHAAFTSAGLSIERTPARMFLDESRGPDGLVLLVRPARELLERVERRMAVHGGTLVVVQRADGDQAARRVRDAALVFAGAGEVPVSRRPRHERNADWRSRLFAPAFAALRGAPGDEAAAVWRRTGLPAVRVRGAGAATIWSLGFNPDHLEPEALRALLDRVTGGLPRDALRAPVPEGAAAVVTLLHDVEEALPGDPRGTASVRAGVETALAAQARHGWRATYNVVGSFAETIPDLVRRIVEEGHELASHGATHDVVADLDAGGVAREVEEAETLLQRVAGVRVRGFRSPRSRWSGRLLELLAERGYLWNAEVDASPYPYRVGGRTPSPLVRMPVATDDWDMVKRGASPRSVREAWQRQVAWAVERNCWVAIGSHPSVLGAAPGRLRAFEEFLAWLAGRGVRVMTLGEGAAWWQRRSAMDSGAAAGGARRAPGGRS